MVFRLGRLRQLSNGFGATAEEDVLAEFLYPIFYRGSNRYMLKEKQITTVIARSEMSSATDGF